MKAVAGFLVVTGLFNYFVRRGDSEDSSAAMIEGMTYGKALFIGVCQGLAVLPGISPVRVDYRCRSLLRDSR